MREKVAVQLKRQEVSGGGSISVVNVLTEFKRACESSRIHENTDIWLFQEFLNAPALPAIKAQLTLSSNNANRHERTITTYAVAVNHLLRRYATDAVIAESDGEIRSFKQSSLTPWDLSKSVSELTI